ncbi:hypothetical protein JTB14_012620, partial [Gonioctena quinquepunctata]
QDAGTKSSSREIDNEQSEMEQEHSDPDYMEENDTDNTDSSDDSASIGEAEAEENVDPCYGGKLSEDFTEEGVPRKRKRFENSPDLRRQLKAQKDKQDLEVKPGCGMNCEKKCSQNIPEERRRDINTQFWDLKRSDRKNVILQNISKADVARRTIIAYGREGKVPANKIDHLPIIEHINSFGTQISHYRREHAPNRKYLPSDLSVRKIFDSFKQQFSSFIGSHDLYRKILKQENNSFVKLGHEECEDCEYFLLHNEDHREDNLAPDCAICQQWDEHMKRADKSRTRYKEYAGREPVEGEIVFSVYLEKGIITYNESFVPVGTKQKGGIKPVATIWHDVIARRKKENVIRTFYYFFLYHRDEKKNIL